MSPSLGAAAKQPGLDTLNLLTLPEVPACNSAADADAVVLHESPYDNISGPCMQQHC